MTSDTLTATIAGKWPRLSEAQRSMLKRLHLDGGHSPLHNASFKTAMALHDKGVVKVTIIDPVTGRVEITEKGKQMAEAIIKLLSPSQSGATQ